MNPPYIEYRRVVELLEDAVEAKIDLEWSHGMVSYNEEYFWAEEGEPVDSDFKLELYSYTNGERHVSNWRASEEELVPEDFMEHRAYEQRTREPAEHMMDEDNSCWWPEVEAIVVRPLSLTFVEMDRNKRKTVNTPAHSAASSKEPKEAKK